MDGPIARSVGTIAPEFALPNGAGEIVRLADCRANGPVVLYFMRAFSCGTCRGHARRLAEQKYRLKRFKTSLVIIGPGTREEAQTLADWLPRRVHVLADEKGEAAAAYGLRRVMLGVVMQSGTFIVDREGVIRYARRATAPGASLDERGLYIALRHL